MYATQLFSLYIRKGRQDPQKLQLHHANDLLAFICECQKQGEWILLVGDMNEVLGITDRGLSKLHQECNLVDACLEKHGITEFTIYQRGTQVIDYVLADRNVICCIQSIWL